MGGGREPGVYISEANRDKMKISFSVILNLLGFFLLGLFMWIEVWAFRDSLDLIILLRFPIVYHLIENCTGSGVEEEFAGGWWPNYVTF